MIVDSHPVEVCRTIRAQRIPKERIDGLARRGRCVSMKRWFHGVREHIAFTPGGLIAAVAQLPGHRHDVNGLYEFLEAGLRGRLLADNGYWAGDDDWKMLSDAGLAVVAMPRGNQEYRHPEISDVVLRGRRARVERRIGLFGRQFNADRTLNRKARHYRARRLAKAVAHNASRRINAAERLPQEATQHFQLAA